MIHLTYSNRTEALLDRLAEAIRAERRAGSRWDPVRLVVPNPFLKEHVRIQLARRLGMAANLSFSYLEGLGRELPVPEGCQVLTPERLKGALLAVLGDSAVLAEEPLAPVRHYLAKDPRGLKAVQLAAELSRLYEEYARSRPDWAKVWRAGRSAAALPGEVWQRSLWLKAVALLDGTGTRHLTLLEALLVPPPRTGAPAPAIHAFGLTHVAQVYHQVFTRLGQRGELYLYALNPCGEFWEDLTTEGEALWRRLRPNRREARKGIGQGEEEPDGGEDPYRLALEGPEALRRWGRPGRENIRLLNDVSECDFDTCFERPGTDTLLHRIQEDILLFQEPDGAEPLAPDPSVRFLACPSPRREAEVVATEIWRLLEDHAGGDRPMSFSDIAVIVPPQEEAAYLAHLQAAFQETRGIPWTQGEGTPTVLKETLEAAEWLLDLPLSGLTRAAVLRLLAHPALARRFGALDAGAWTRWCEALGIVRGADREDWAGTYLDQDALNWDQGLKRLALGAFMTDGAELAEGDSAYLPLPVSDLASGGRFLELVRALLEDARDLERGHLEPRAWVRRLERYLTVWLQGDDEPSVRAVERILEHLRGILEAAPEALALPGLGYPAARFLVLEALERLRRQQPCRLARGVVVSSYAPMRAIPFRAVFLMGLGEGVFPGRDERGALDLRAKGRRPGDVAQTEKEKYLFLETLIATRDRLCLSYVAQDELTGVALEPSGLFKEFRGLAARYLQPERGAEALTRRHPLRRYDPVYFPGWFPDPAGADGLRTYAAIAQAEARALWLGRDLRRGRPLPLPQALGALPLEPGLGARLEAWLGHPGVGQPRAEAGVLTLSLADLRRWLDCPLTGAAAVRLGLRGEDLEDRASVVEEPFASAFLDTYRLQRDVTFGAARAGTAPGADYDAALKGLQARGRAPFGLFAQAERSANLEPVHGWLQLLAGAHPETWRLGPGRAADGPADRIGPPLALTVPVRGREQRVELVGELQPQLWGGSLFLESGKAPKTATEAVRRKALRAYLDQLVRACWEPAETGHRAWFLFAGEAGRSAAVRSFTFQPVTAEQGRTLLAGWLRDLLEGDNAVLMPIEAVLEEAGNGGPTPESIRRFVAARLEGGRGFSSLYGPVAAPQSYEPPADLAAIVQRRFGGFLEQVRAFDVEEAP